MVNALYRPAAILLWLALPLASFGQKFYTYIGDLGRTTY